jgi:hypothetical protein
VKISGAAKFRHSIIAAQRLGGIAISLNLSPAREAALRAAADPARVMSMFIRRAFKEVVAGVPPHGFQLEISPEGRLHLHGHLIPGDLTDRKRMKRALMAAGGSLDGRAASRQVKLKQIYDAPGWARYIAMDGRKTRRELGTDKITFLSAGLRALTRDSWMGGVVFRSTGA